MKWMIKAENLTKKYGHLTAVDNLNFEILKNEIFGLLGPNGVGKTTTIHMICGLLQLSAGTITFKIQNGKSRKSLIGYCPQENIFYPKLTCQEQLLFIGQLYGISLKKLRTRAVELLEMMGLQSVIPEITAILILTAIYFIIGALLFKKRHLKGVTT